MKKIFGLAISAVLLIALAVGGTWAFFSDTETSSGNIFTAGTIDLEVNNENPWTTTLWATLDDWKPDQTASVAQITLKNVGTNPMDVWIKITKTAVGDGILVYPPSPLTPVASSEPEFVEGGGDYVNNTTAPYGYAAVNDIDTQIRYELTVDDGSTPDNKIQYINDYTIATNGTLGTTGIDTYYIWIGNIAATGTLTVDQNFKLDAGAGNEYQGDTMTFTIEFFAQQSEGDTAPTAPATELANYARP